MKQNIKNLLSIYLIKLNYFKSILLLRVFPLLMLFNVLSCESGKNFNVFSSQEIPEKVVKDKEVLDSKKEESSLKNDLNKKMDKNKKSKKSGDLNLSDISVIGEARKDKSEIISFFFDLFNYDSDEVNQSKKEPSKAESVQKVLREDLKEKKLIKPLKVTKNDLEVTPKMIPT